MELNNLVNKNMKKGFDLLFVLVSDIENEQVFLDKFYVNKQEYESFSRYFGENYELVDNHPKTYSYFYRFQKVRLYDLIEVFELTATSAEKVSLIDELNNQLKNIAISLDRNNPFVLHNYEARRVVNDFFELREYVNNKTSDNFPLELDEINNQDPVVFRMYNVGQANMSALLVGENKYPLFIFDLGKSRKCKEAIDLLQNHLPQLNSGTTTTIVISHYDNDHINMVNYLPLGGKSLQFIMPEFLHASDVYKPNIQLLLFRSILNSNKACFVINESLNNPLIIRNYFTLVQGCKKRRDLNQSTDENSHGLMVNLSIDGKQLLIPGDVLYEDVFTSLTNPFAPTYIIIPHHSCFYGGSINPSVVSLYNLEESFTFCGPHGGYYHPNKTHFQHFKINDKKIVRLARNNKNPSVFDYHAKIADTYYDIKTGQYYDWIFR